MGYTHYWTQNIQSRKLWRENEDTINEWARKIVKPFEGILDDVRIGPGFINFNGRGEYSHEDFGIDVRGRDWDFCKTARKPYDVPVCMCLLLLLGYTGFELSSDGFGSSRGEMDVLDSGRRVLNSNHQWYEPISQLRQLGFTVNVSLDEQEDSTYFDMVVEVIPPQTTEGESNE